MGRNRKTSKVEIKGSFYDRMLKYSSEINIRGHLVGDNTKENDQIKDARKSS